MKRILLNTDHTRISSDTMQVLQERLILEVNTISQSGTASYDTDYASINLPFDMAMHTQIKKVVASKKALAPQMLIVIGIGGSNLGAMAVLQALHGRLYNEKKSDISVYFADTVDTDYIQDILSLAEKPQL